MGVPGLAPLFFKKYPKYVNHFIGKSNYKQVDCLYLDANGLLHAATQQVFNYGQGKSMLDRFSNLSYSEKVTKSFDLFFDNLMELIDIVRPTELLFIAFDGPAPVAKQTQQRQRRFMSVMNNSSSDTSTAFNTSSITPGTEFSFDLEKYFNFRLRKDGNTHPILSKITTLFSSQREPGEGEHKLLDYIRALSLETRRNKTHCLFSPDGDLILLTLVLASINECNISLFREDIYNNSYYHLVDMKGIANTIPKDKVLEFVFSSTFVGNDFSPKLRMFYYLKDGINLMENICNKLRTPLIKNNKLDEDSFKEFIRVMQRRETEYFNQQLSKTPDDERFVYKILLTSTNSNGINFSEFRSKYYEKFGDNTVIKNVCESYMKMLIWVFEYYTKGLPSWDYFYPYYYPPLMTDFSNYVNSNSLSFTFVKGEPSTPFVSLFSVIPFESKELLPDHLRCSVQNTEKFEIDYEGNTKEYQAIAKVSFIDREHVNNIVNKFKKENDKYKRNKIDKTYKYFKSDKKIKITTKYGTCITNVVKI